MTQIKQKPHILKSGNFLVQGSILAVSGIIVKIIGLAYRIPLVRILGDEGMGYYSFAFDLYTIILLITSFAFPVAISKIVSARIAKNDYINADRFLKLSLCYATVIGCAGCLFTVFSADWFADVFYKQPLCKYALLSLAPTIWLMSYQGILRGYFQGMSTMVPTAIAQILDQLANAFISVSSAWWLCDRVLKDAGSSSKAAAWGAVGAAVGTGAGAIAALAFLLILFIRNREKWKGMVNHSISCGFTGDSYRNICKSLILVITPIMLLNVINNCTGVIDSGIFSSTMISLFNVDSTSVAADYGVYTSKFSTLANIPVVITNALSSSIIVAMTIHVTEDNINIIRKEITCVLKYTVLISLPAAIGLAVLGDPIITLLFGKSDLAVSMLKLGAPSILFTSLATISASILQGNGYMKKPVTNVIISEIFHIIILIIMLRIFNLGIFAVVIAVNLYVMLLFTLNMFFIEKKLNYKTELMTIYIKPLICSAVMGITGYFCLKAVKMFTSSSFLITVICITVSVIVYIAMIAVTGCITREELEDFWKSK